jgi:hypothetical protein
MNAVMALKKTPRGGLAVRTGIARRKIEFLVSQGGVVVSDNGWTAVVRVGDRTATVEPFGMVTWKPIQ